MLLQTASETSAAADAMCVVETHLPMRDGVDVTAPAVLLAARNTVFLVAGSDKSPAVRAVFADPYDPQRFPAQIVQRKGRNVTWFFDSDAAYELLSTVLDARRFGDVSVRGLTITDGWLGLSMTKR